MSSANDKQVGGSHYQGKYQHWDLVCDTRMPYLLGCATKYLVRWRKKNGLQDLEKAFHYLQKSKEREVTQHTSENYEGRFRYFIEQNFDETQMPEARAYWFIYYGNLDMAMQEVTGLIERLLIDTKLLSEIEKNTKTE